MQLTEAGNITSVWTNFVEYAGYIIRQIDSSSCATYSKVVHSLSVQRANFDYNATGGTAGTAVSPVLPGQLVIAVGNTEVGNPEVSNPANAIVTAIYYY